tara:strand:+ start:300 stop:614 length:315 start_codon:yes stop_codon:yes gene_type:complete
MKSDQLKIELEKMAENGKPLLDDYLDYAGKYKTKAEEYVDTLLDDLVKDQRMSDMTMVTAIDANSTNVDQQLAEIKSKLKTGEYLFDRQSFKIYVFSRYPNSAN